jgi:hypothetical protein
MEFEDGKKVRSYGRVHVALQNHDGKTWFSNIPRRPVNSSRRAGPLADCSQEIYLESFNWLVRVIGEDFKDLDYDARGGRATYDPDWPSRVQFSKCLD